MYAQDVSFIDKSTPKLKFSMLMISKSTLLAIDVNVQREQGLLVFTLLCIMRVVIGKLF